MFALVVCSMCVCWYGAVCECGKFILKVNFKTQNIVSEDLGFG